MDHVDDPLAQLPPQAAIPSEPPALPAPVAADVARTAGALPPLSPGWQAPWGSGSREKPGHSGPKPLSGVTLAEVLMSPVQELLGLLDKTASKTVRPEAGQSMVEWVQCGLPAFPFPEDVRGSFMDHVI